MPHLRRVGSRLAYQKAAGRVAAAAASSSAEPSPALTATASSRQGAPLFLQAHDGSQTPDPGHDPEETVADRRRRESSRRAASALVGLSQRARHARAPTTVKREEGEGEEEDSTNTSIEMSTADMDEADFEEVEITDEAEPSVKLEDSQAAPLPPEPEHEVIEIKDESSDEGFQELSCFSASATPAEPPATNVPPPPSTPKKPRRQPNKRKAAVARLTDDTGGPSRPSTARQGSRERNQASPAPRPVLARDFDWPEHFLNLERTFKVSH